MILQFILILLISLSVFAIHANITDNFYAAPDDLKNYSLGEIIRTRTINVNKTALPSLKSIQNTFQILYRSQGFDQSQPQANVLTLFVPQQFNSTLPIELVLVSAAYDSDNPECGPSRSILNGKNVPELLTIGMHSTKGRLYAMADYEGPKAAFSQGNVAAAGNLDALRAILQFDVVIPNWQKDHVRIGLEGYSGGGLAVAWTLQRLPSYASELKSQVIGAAMGGVPSNATQVAFFQNRSLGAGFVIVGLFGQAAVDSRIRHWIELHGLPGQIELARQYTDMLCVENVLLPFVYQDVAQIYFNLSAKSVLKDLSFPYQESTVAVASTQSYPVYQIEIPILLTQAIDDQFVPVETNDEYYQRLCESDGKNISVEYVRNSAGKHIQTAILSAPYAALFLQDRFDGVAAVKGCQEKNETLTLDDPRFLSAFGEQNLQALREALENAALLE